MPYVGIKKFSYKFTATSGAKMKQLSSKIVDLMICRPLFRLAKKIRAE